MRLYPSAQDRVPRKLAAKYESNAGRYWDLFYKRNGDKFFKDRHYLDKEFPELAQGALNVLEVGCGVGNTIYPLLGLNPALHVYACDFSTRAVELVKQHPDHSSGRVTAFVADITCTPLAETIPRSTIDYCTMVFVLSAVAPEHMKQALRNVASVMRRQTGRVLFRDYADGDLAQHRLQDKGVKMISPQFYVRGDGTCCYYFTEAGLVELFAALGFVCEELVVHAKVIENRKSGVQMPRRWVQAVFRYTGGEAPDGQQQQHKEKPQQQQHKEKQQQQQHKEKQQQQHKEKQQDRQEELQPQPQGCCQLQPPQQWPQQEHLEQKVGQARKGEPTASRPSVVMYPSGISVEAVAAAVATAAATLEERAGGASSCSGPPSSITFGGWHWRLPFSAGAALKQRQVLVVGAALLQQQRSWESASLLLLHGVRGSMGDWGPGGVAVQLQDLQQPQQQQHHQQEWHRQDKLPFASQPDQEGQGLCAPEADWDPYADGAAAAVLALALVRAGARRVGAVMHDVEYAAGFTGVLHLNEASVVQERIRRCWITATMGRRQAGKLLQGILQDGVAVCVLAS